MTNNKISVGEALEKIESGQSLEGFSVDFNHIKVEALDVMKLSKGGVHVPEEAIYYEDDDIAFDEDFEGDWERIDYDPIQEPSVEREIKIILRKDIQKWIDKRNIHLEKLIENLLEGFYQSQKIVKEE